MTDPKGCYNSKRCLPKTKETTLEGKTTVASVSDSVMNQEGTLERVRCDDLGQVAGRNEIKTMATEKKLERDVPLVKKGAELATTENKAPNEQESTVIGSAEEVVGEAESASSNVNPKRSPFTSLSQVDADLHLARALQEQERAYMLLRMGSEGSDFDSSGSGTLDVDEEDDFGDDLGEEANAHYSRAHGLWQGSPNESDEGNKEDIDGTLFDDDEAYARALQEREDRETTAMLARAGIQVQGLHDWETAEYESDSDTSQDMWQEMDPDNMSYEELVALGEAVGTENKGLATEVIAALPSSSYGLDKRCSNGETEQCVICRHEYEEKDVILTLPCKHLYHSECIQQWLQINKVCPVCNKEVATSVGEKKSDISTT